MQSEKLKKVETGRKTIKSKADVQMNAGDKPLLTLFCAPASGSTAINYLAQDPELAKREAAVIFEATRKQKK